MRAIEKFLEVLFNDNKYRVTKILAQVILIIVAFTIASFYLSDFNRVYIVIFAPLLTLILILSLIKTFWYNRKNDIKTSVSDWVGKAISFIILTVILFSYYKEEKLEIAVYDEIEEKLGSENFTIDFVDKIEIGEDYILVGYTIEDDNTHHLGRFYWRDGELVLDSTSEIEDEAE